MKSYSDQPLITVYPFFVMLLTELFYVALTAFYPNFSIEELVAHFNETCQTLDSVTPVNHKIPQSSAQTGLNECRRL